MRLTVEQRMQLPTEGYGLLIGWNAISAYTRHRLSTLQRWRDRFGFPVSILPGGNVCTTVTLIDQWLLSRAEIYDKERLANKARRKDSTNEISKDQPGRGPGEYQSAK